MCFTEYNKSALDVHIVLIYISIIIIIIIL